MKTRGPIVWLFLFFTSTLLVGVMSSRAWAVEEKPRVLLATFGPGPLIFERFGHNALIVIDPAQPPNQHPNQPPNQPTPAYNWGVFDFDQPGFIRRFVQGRMLYQVRAFDAQDMLLAYEKELGRSVVLDELDLTDAQTSRLLAHVRAQDTDATRDYRYDYYLDNCSTRIRDAINFAVDGRLKRETQIIPTSASFRWHTRRATVEEPLLSLGIDLALGKPGDQPMSVWQEMFIPQQLHEHLNKHGLVIGSRVLAEKNIDVDHAVPVVVWPYTLGAGLFVGALMMLLGKSGWIRSAYAIAFMWWMLSSFGFAVMIFFRFTDHWAAHFNANIFQMSVLSPVLLVMVLIKRCRSSGAISQLAIISAGLSLFGCVGRFAFDFLDQGNGPTLGLAVPVNIGAAIAMWLCWRGTRGQQLSRF